LTAITADDFCTAAMIAGTERERTIRYIMERRCRDGGFCFYRLNEPNAADTYFALDSLRLLRCMPRDPATAAYLHSLQRDDGGYASLYIGYYVIKSLEILTSPPRIRPDAWLSGIIPILHERNRPIESTSCFERAYLFSDLCRALSIRLDETLRTELVRAIFACRHPDGGFGDLRSTMIETFHALSILSFLGHPLPVDRVERFFVECITRSSGT